MKTVPKNILWLFLIFITFLANCFSNKVTVREYHTMQEYNNKINLQIMEQSWTGWSEKQPEPKVEIIAVKKGEMIKRSDSSGSYLIITIKDIKNDFVVVHFKNKGVVEYNGRGINLLSKNYKWSVIIKYNEEYGLASQTLDMGTIWKLIFIK